MTSLAMGVVAVRPATDEIPSAVFTNIDKMRM